MTRSGRDLCVHTQVGKGWAKGLTAKTDARVARMAVRQVGRKRGPYRSRRRDESVTREWSWTPDVAYAVGLIATDGNLSPSGRHVSLTSNDRDLLEIFLRCIGRSAHVGTVHGGFGTTSLRVQVGDVGLYRWLLSIGLTPRKSLTLGAISVPDGLFPHLCRGLLDGDGSILDVTYEGTGHAKGRSYRTIVVRFVSASQRHIAWLSDTIAALYGIKGSRSSNRGVWRLTYAKEASLRLLAILYASDEVPCLSRKRDIWTRFIRDGRAAAVLDGKMEADSPR